jgi:uncharacterized protein (TIGR02757 family)
MTLAEIREFLEEKSSLYNRPAFIAQDPVSVPRSFDRKENAEIGGFLAATLAWGKREQILVSARRLMGIMDHDPYGFLTGASPEELAVASRFCHRTFNGADAHFFFLALRNLYLRHGGLEAVFTRGYREGGSVAAALSHFREVFLEPGAPARSLRHVADVRAGSAAKRLNMFLRWMVRDDHRGVDLGLWKGIPPSALMLPLDVHTGNVSRKLGILTRSQNDWKAVEEVTAALRHFDPRDPVKYDFALFGLGRFEGF